MLLVELLRKKVYAMVAPTTDAFARGVGRYSFFDAVEEAARMAWDESKRLWGIGTPIAIATLSMYAVSSVTTIFVGHLGNLPLAAASIGLFSARRSPITASAKDLRRGESGGASLMRRAK